MPKISQLSALTVPDAGDELPIVDVSASTTKKITRQDLLSGAPLPADTVDTQAIDDGAVTLPKISIGADMAWQSWTPTLSGMSGGTITFAKYIQIGKTVTFRFMYTFAGAGMGTSPSFTLPVEAHADYSAIELSFANGSYRDASATTSYPLTSLMLGSTTVCRLFIPNVSATYGTYTSPTSTVPITWATGDYVLLTGVYEAA